MLRKYGKFGNMNVAMFRDALKVKEKVHKLYDACIIFCVLVGLSIYGYFIGQSIVGLVLFDVLSWGICARRVMNYNEAEDKFKEKYPKNSELLLESDSYLKERYIVSYNYNVTQVETLEKEYAEVEEIKDLSSHSKKPPLSTEELKRYREILLCTKNDYENILYQQSTNCEYDFTIMGESKSKHLERVIERQMLK